MDMLSIFIGAALAAILVVFVSRPLWKARRAAQAESQLDTLQAQYESLLTQIRELDFDHATGKVTNEDHTALREQLVGAAAGVLRQIDALFEAMPGARAIAQEDEIERAVTARRRRTARLPKSFKTSEVLETDLEAEIEARRKRKPTPAATLDDEIETEVAARRQALSCPTCGKPIQVGDAFCPKCGAPLGTQVAR